MIKAKLYFAAWLSLFSWLSVRVDGTILFTNHSVTVSVIITCASTGFRSRSAVISR